MKKPKILIAYTNTGAGHITPALAIAERIEELYPDQFMIIKSNFFKDAGADKFNNKIEKSWDFLLKRSWLTKILQGICRVFYPLSPYLVQTLRPDVVKLSIKYIDSVQPDLIFSTHFFCHSMAIEAKKHLNLNFKVIGLNPDTFDTFPQWDKRGDCLLMCSDLALDRAVKNGHDKNKIKIVPQPLRKEFSTVQEYNQKDIRREYGLREDVFTIFMSDGGQGVGRSYKSVRSLITKKYPLNIIVVCGKNQSLYDKMTKFQNELKESNHPVQIFPYMFVDSITPFIQMSDLFIGKSGPATIWECLKLHLPVLINFSANNAERITASYFVKHKAALSCTIPFLLAKKVKTILDQPSILQTLKANISELDIFQDGSTIIAHFIIKQLNTED